MHFHVLARLGAGYLVSLIHGPQTGRTILQLWLLLDQAALVAESQKPGFQVLLSVNTSISRIYPIRMGQVGSRDEKLSPLINVMINISGTHTNSVQNSTNNAFTIHCVALV